MCDQQVVEPLLEHENRKRRLEQDEAHHSEIGRNNKNPPVCDIEGINTKEDKSLKYSDTVAGNDLNTKEVNARSKKQRVGWLDSVTETPNSAPSKPVKGFARQT